MVLTMAKPASAKGNAATEARVCVAAVAAAHGVRGLLRLKPFTEIPEACVTYGPLTTADGARTFKFEKLGMHKGHGQREGNFNATPHFIRLFARKFREHPMGIPRFIRTNIRLNREAKARRDAGRGGGETP